MTIYERSISVVLLAGGLGTRMQTSTPKQFIHLNNLPIACYSFEVFLAMPEVAEIIIVCETAYQSLFISKRPNLHLNFAKPGKRRQDSVYNGFKQTNVNAELICIHDSARPFISTELVRPVLLAANEVGAAAMGMPVKFTVKECDENGFVTRTPSRDTVWEIQTPQVIRPDLLKEGFKKVNQSNLTVTDDVSLVELLGHPVRIIKGSYENIKITTSEDLVLAETLARKSDGKFSL